MAGSDPSSSQPSSSRPLSPTSTRSRSMTSMPELAIDSDVVPPALREIAPMLCVANEVEPKWPRIAHHCRSYAFQKAQELYLTYSDRDVYQFMTLLGQRLDTKHEATFSARKKNSDATEVQNLYQEYYENHVKKLAGTAEADRYNSELVKAYQTANILFEVLRSVAKKEAVEIAPKILEIDQYVKKKIELYMPYNILPLDILPLDRGSKNQAIMKLPEIEAVVTALRTTFALPWPENNQKPDQDLLDWLQVRFGFQKYNVANQREHLILLLANAHIRQPPADTVKLDDNALNEVMEKMLENYKQWCKYLGRQSSLRLPNIQQDAQQRKILYMGLFLLIWGEAANLRFMPECLCYIYHHMAGELCETLCDNVSALPREKIRPEEFFLETVVTPIYKVISEEVEKNIEGTAKHSQWRNYDDLNEFFWSNKCFCLKWPMDEDNDFFKWGGHRNKWMAKTNFVESRSYWYLFRSFDRMWTFFILALQAMIIIAWHDTGSPTELFSVSVFKEVLTIVITASILKSLQGILDIFFSWDARKSMKCTQILRYLLKAVVAAAWVIILLACYVHTWENPTGLVKTFQNFASWWNFPYSYILAVVAYILPNVPAAIFFMFPMLKRRIERSDRRICTILTWWQQPRLYVGRGMHEDLSSLFKYTIFWILLLISKFAFSYYIEIRPLVKTTKLIMRMSVGNYEWNGLFPQARKNIGVVISVWSPIILVYFMDTQIWYAIFSTIFGVIYGAFRHLGEIQTLGMLRSQFQSFPEALSACLVPQMKEKEQKKGLKSSLPETFEQVKLVEKNELANFAQIWNSVIASFRKEDLINNREMDLLVFAYSRVSTFGSLQWPAFLLASKIPIALEMVKDFEGNDAALQKIINADENMQLAVKECYESSKSVLRTIISGEREKKFVKEIIEEVDKHITRNTLLEIVKISKLPLLYDKFVQLVECLLKEDTEVTFREKVLLIQDMIEVVTEDIVIGGREFLPSTYGSQPIQGVTRISLTEGIPFRSIRDFPRDDAWDKQIKRLHFLLTVKESAMDVPANLEARRRLTYFTNSLFMDMPNAPKVQNMLPFSVLTPYYTEEVLISEKDLQEENEDGVSIIFYLQKIYPDEWKNFLQRVCGTEDLTLRTPEKINELRHWVSYRAQTLTRTVRGMMYYRKALELQSLLEMEKDGESLGGYSTAIESITDEQEKGERALEAQSQAVADMKFTYVVSCQQYGKQKIIDKERAADILNLMKTYPSLRVAYIDEVEEMKDNKPHKVYYSILLKAVDGLDQIIYRIKLPGNPILGEGKPENQNHAIIFTRGEALQTIDMNQDNYLEEAFKMRNLLEEFVKKHGVRRPTILGLREHIFTGSVSSLAWFMSNQETSFVTIVQRLLANPLKVRFHYGHPDVFDRLFHITRGGISKASKGINLSEDIFGGFNSTLRHGTVTYHEYMQVGKGRDVGLNQISQFEAKVANGNGEQTLSRDIYRLGHRFDFFRMLSCYFTSVGFYFSSLMTVLTLYIFLYGRMYLVLSGLERAMLHEASVQHNTAVEAALASQSFVQLGFLLALPMVMEIGLERGFLNAFSDFVMKQLQMAAVFFTFSLGTKTHYYGRTLLHGGAKYRATGRGFVVFRAKFADNYRFYSRSHFVKGLELMLLLIVDTVYSQSHRKTVLYILITYSMWFMVGAWLFAPFLFNPSGFEWQKIVDDWTDWNEWINNYGVSGLPHEKSWESWWDAEQDHLKHAGLSPRIFEILLSFRFLLYPRGLVYHQNVASVLFYALFWAVIAIVLLVLKTRRGLSGDSLPMIRLLGWFSFLVLLCFIIGIVVLGLPISAFFASCLSHMVTGWAFLQIALACRPLLQRAGFWNCVRELARIYDHIMGLLLFTPVAILAWFPFVSEFQTRILFNQAFSRGLQISRILARRK